MSTLAVGHQLLVGALLDHLALLDYSYLIGILDSGQSVSYFDASLAFGGLFQSLINECLLIETSWLVL